MISNLYAALIAAGTLVIGILLGIWIRLRHNHCFLFV